MAETLIELEGPAAPRLERWARRILFTSCTLLLCGGLLGLALVGTSKGVSPAKELARIQAFIVEAKTARLTATTVSEQRDGDGDLGSSYKDTSRITGSVVLPDRSQWVEEDGSMAYEGIIVPGASYTREADTREDLAAEQWVYEALAAPEPKAGEPVPPELVAAADVAGAFGAADFLDLLRAAETPTRVGPHTIKVRIDVSDLPEFTDPEDEDAPPPDMTAELTSTSEGRLDRLVLRMVERDPEMGDFTGTADVRFTHWGQPLTIAAPDATAVDPTPTIAEDDLAAFDAAPLLGLRRLPAGWALLTAEVWTAEDDADAEAGECPEVSLSYGNPAEQVAAEQRAETLSEEDSEAMQWPETIEVSLTPADCESWNVLEDGDAITLGGRPATIVRGTASEDEYVTSIQLIVGATRVLVESDGPEATTLAAASDLVPFDLATQPVHRQAPAVG